jgi:hypothetical protein
MPRDNTTPNKEGTGKVPKTVLVDKNAPVIGIEEITDNTGHTEETEVTIPGLNRTYTVKPDTEQIVPTAHGIPRKYATLTDSVARAANEANFGRARMLMNNMAMYPQPGMPFGMPGAPHHQNFMYQSQTYAAYPDPVIPPAARWIPPHVQLSQEYQDYY